MKLVIFVAVAAVLIAGLAFAAARQQKTTQGSDPKEPAPRADDGSAKSTAEAGAPAAVLELAGFALAHATWSVSDTSADELLVPMLLIHDRAGNRKLVRFEAESQVEAIESGKAEAAKATTASSSWAFAREGSWRPNDRAEAGDVVVIDFWSPEMSKPATVILPFRRATGDERFRVFSPVLVLDGKTDSSPEGERMLQGIRAGVMSHEMAAELWPKWE